ncbi:cyclase family protein [Acidicapsa ligni]|uniref:cyclase family protein n=1 Tax=Acidicapsa ligni TaxID=542300 RepID=UPI0021DF53EE|nr:cyclase family protein [Acidicapsa ligni]
MIYDLAQPHYNHAPQFPGQPPNSIEYQQLAVVDGATVERCTFMSHSGSHVDAPFHYLPHLPCIHELPLSHFYGPCIALDLHGFSSSHPIAADDLRKHESLITRGIFILLKTGWGEKRANTKEFLTAWPYMSGNGAQYLLDREVKGMGIDGLSTGGYPGQEAESAAHKLLLGAQKLLLEDIHIPEQLLDRKQRHFAAFPILIANAGGAWTRPIVWDDGDLDSESSAAETATKLPDHVTSLMALQRGPA